MARDNPLAELLIERGVLLADGATGTNLFALGLTSGDAPELWNVDNPDKVRQLHRGFVDAGADIILTNSFGGTRHRLKLHQADHRVHELNRHAALLAREVAATANRRVIVAGSVGPTGELMVPLGELTPEQAEISFGEQIDGLIDGGADVIWIETMSAAEEMRAAANAAASRGMPYTLTASFDTAGRTMMGLAPSDIHGVLPGGENGPTAVGANCGVGASDLLASLLDMTEANASATFIAKANCGIPQIRGDKVEYTGTPDLMANYVHLAVDAGASIIGGCCGTSCDHLAAMRDALDNHVRGPRPNIEQITAGIGDLVNKTAAANDDAPKRQRRRRRG